MGFHLYRVIHFVAYSITEMGRLFRGLAGHNFCFSLNRICLVPVKTHFSTSKKKKCLKAPFRPFPWNVERTSSADSARGQRSHQARVEKASACGLNWKLYGTREKFFMVVSRVIPASCISYQSSVEMT